MGYQNEINQNTGVYSPRPLSFGSNYRGPNDSYIAQDTIPAQSVTGQYTQVPDVLQMGNKNSNPQTAMAQLNTSPQPYSGMGSKEYRETYKQDNYKTFLELLDAQKQKYIGSSIASEPKKINTPAISKSESIASNNDMPQSVQATIDASKQGASYPDSGLIAGEADNGGTNWKSALTTVQAAADSISKAQQNLARTQYESDVADWMKKGQYWFDVNADLKPDLEKYMADMPSSLDSLQEGSWVTSLQSGNSDTVGEIAFGNWLNPAGIKLENDTASAFLNPLNILEQQGWVDEGMVNYVGGKAAEGGISGGFVGAIIGVIDGIFSWNSAKDEDAKRKKAAQEEYERKLQEWTFNNNKRLMDARIKRDKEIEATKAAYRDKNEAVAKAEKTQKITDIAAARSNMASALLNAGNITANNRAARAARWSK